MSRILIAFATVDGHTGLIAEGIAALLERAGQPVTLHEVGSAEACPFDRFDAVIVGGPIRYGRFPKPLRNFVRIHATDLTSRPNAFFSVSLSAVAAQDDAARCMEDFFTQAGWAPEESAAFAGALLYRQYNPLLRFVMHRIALAHGRETDTSVDHDFTDWEAVDRFAARFLARLRAPLAA